MYDKETYVSMHISFRLFKAWPWLKFDFLMRNFAAYVKKVHEHVPVFYKSQHCVE